jgi:hypothetical protein
VAIPQLFIFEQSFYPGNSTKYRCASTGYTAEWQRRVYFTIFASYVLIIPVLCMTIWYIQIIHTINTSTKMWTQNIHRTSLTSSTKIRTVKLALTIIIVFVICWTPYMLITLIEIYSNGHFHKPSWLDGVLQIICLHQSGLNPLIYIAFNQKQKYSSTPATSTYSQKNSRRQRPSAISSCSIAETQFRNTEEDKSRKSFQV